MLLGYTCLAPKSVTQLFNLWVDVRRSCALADGAYGATAYRHSRCVLGLSNARNIRMALQCVSQRNARYVVAAIPFAFRIETFY